MRRASLASVILGLVSLAGTAHGLGLVADDRYTLLRYRLDRFDPTITTETTTPETPFGPFPAQPGSDIALLDEGRLLAATAHGESSASFDFSSFPYYTFVQRESFFSITFRVDGDGRIDLHGSGAFGSEITVTRGDDVLFDFVGSDGGSQDDYDAPLEPDEYTVSALARAPGSIGDGQVFDLSFRVTDTVPEPTTLLLLGTGIAGLVVAARSRQH